MRIFDTMIPELGEQVWEEGLRVTAQDVDRAAEAALRAREERGDLEAHPSACQVTVQLRTAAPPGPRVVRVVQVKGETWLAC